MSVYYSSRYQKYYDKLSSSNLNKASSSISLNVSDLARNTLELASEFDGLSWTELGKDELKNNVLTGMVDSTNKFKNDVLGNLVKASDMAYNDLLPLLSKLKDKDKEYEELQSKISSLDEESDKHSYFVKATVLEKEMSSLSREIESSINAIKSLNSFSGGSRSDGVVAASSLIDVTDRREKNTTTKVTTSSNTSLISMYQNNKNNTTSGINVKSNIKNISEEVMRRKEEEDSSNSVKAAISKTSTNTSNKTTITKKKVNTLNGSQSDIVNKLINIKKSKGGSSETSTNSSASSDLTKNNSKVKKLNALGETFNVVNTAIDVNSYAQTAYTKGIRQDSNPARYGDLCLAFSYVHASNMYNGSTGDNAESALHWAHAAEFYDYFSDSKQEIMNQIYTQITSGKPVILQVNGNSSGTARHFVTVVGFKDSVKSANTLKDSDLLILDSWDGKIERMDQSGSRFMTTGAQTHKSYSGYYLRILK